MKQVQEPDISEKRQRNGGKRFSGIWLSFQFLSWSLFLFISHRKVTMTTSHWSLSIYTSFWVDHHYNLFLNVRIIWSSLKQIAKMNRKATGEIIQGNWLVLNRQIEGRERIAREIKAIKVSKAIRVERRREMKYISSLLSSLFPPSFRIHKQLPRNHTHSLTTFMRAKWFLFHILPYTSNIGDGALWMYLSSVHH